MNLLFFLCKYLKSHKVVSICMYQIRRCGILGALLNNIIGNIISTDILPELFALVKAHKLAVARRKAQLAALHEAHARFLARKLAEQQALQEAEQQALQVAELKESCCYVAAEIDWKKFCGTDAELEDLCFSDGDMN